MPVIRKGRLIAGLLSLVLISAISGTAATAQTHAQTHADTDAAPAQTHA